MLYTRHGWLVIRFQQSHEHELTSQEPASQSSGEAHTQSTGVSKFKHPDKEGANTNIRGNASPQSSDSKQHRHKLVCSLMQQTHRELPIAKG